MIFITAIAFFEDAEKIITADNNLTNFPSLKQELEIRYRRLMGGNILN